MEQLLKKKSSRFEFDDYKFGKRIGEFSDPALDIIRLVLPINEKYILLIHDHQRFFSDEDIDSEKNREVVVIYYGGGETKPKRSVIRVYNEKYPKGKDISEFGYKAGNRFTFKKLEG